MREPMPNERYQDKQSDVVTVRSVSFRRVNFVREGYACPAFMLVHHFAEQYTLISGVK